MSKYKAEVIADSTGKWCGNQLRFNTEQEAWDYVSDLALRWTAVRSVRVVCTCCPYHETGGSLDESCGGDHAQAS